MGEAHAGELRGRQRQRLAEELAERFRSGETSIQALAEEFGRRPSTVRRLLHEAGVTTPATPHVGASDTQLAALLVAGYRNGESIAALARRTSLDRRAIRRLLATAGVSLPARGSRPGEAEAELLARRYLQGDSIRLLAASAGCSYSTMRALLIDRGVRLRQSNTIRRDIK